jgi:hypothetical protein
MSGGEDIVNAPVGLCELGDDVKFVPGLTSLKEMDRIGEDAAVFGHSVRTDDQGQMI